MEELVFGNSLIIQVIFSYLDFEEVKEMRKVSTTFAAAGLYRFKRDQNIYFNFKMRGSDARNRGNWDCDKTNILKFVAKPENIWIAKRLKLSINEITFSKKLKGFLIKHGHNTTHMKLVLEEKELINNSFYDLLIQILKSWCLNLEHLAIDQLPGVKYRTIGSKSSFQSKFFSELKSLSTKLTFLEIVGQPFDTGSQLFLSRFIGRLICNSPNLKVLKLIGNGQNMNGIIDRFCHFSNFSSNFEILEAGNNIDVQMLSHLTEQCCPRLKKLVFNTKDQIMAGDFNSPLILPSAVNSGLIEVRWKHIYYYQQSIPILLSLFPNVETLALETFSIHNDGRPKPVYETSFPNVKTLHLKFLEKIMLFPRTIRWLLKILPGVEKMEFSGVDRPFYLRVILKGIENADSIKHLDLGLGQNFESWINQDVFEPFPKNIRITVHK